VWPRGLNDIRVPAGPHITSWVKSRAIAFAKAREAEKRRAEAAQQPHVRAA
jgi:hypothetical protein